MKKITSDQIRNLAESGGLEFAVLKAFIEVESGGTGFDKVTGKLLIQFEPSWYRKRAPFAPSGAWSSNKVDVQSKEWLAFNDAFAKDATGAMEATSIGLPQIMGFHWKRLGYSTVGAMWDDFKKGEFEQVAALVRFIRTDNKLFAALQRKDWHQVASIYNGASYAEMAKKWKREPYNISLEKAYVNWSNLE
jgi:hypothetical protein